MNQLILDCGCLCSYITHCVKITTWAVVQVVILATVPCEEVVTMQTHWVLWLGLPKSRLHAHSLCHVHLPVCSLCFCVAWNLFTCSTHEQTEKTTTISVIVFKNYILFRFWTSLKIKRCFIPLVFLYPLSTHTVVICICSFCLRSLHKSVNSIVYLKFKPDPLLWLAPWSITSTVCLCMFSTVFMPGHIKVNHTGNQDILPWREPPPNKIITTVSTGNSTPFWSASLNI